MLLTQIIPDKDYVKEAVKDQIKSFIYRSEHLSDKQQRQVLSDLESADPHIDVSKILYNAFKFALHKWIKQNMELADLWKNVAINSSNGNDAPHVVANTTVKKFKEQFVEIDVPYKKDIIRMAEILTKETEEQIRTEKVSLSDAFTSRHRYADRNYKRLQYHIYVIRRLQGVLNK